MTQLKTLLNNSPMSGYQMLIVAICFILNFNDGIDALVVSYTGGEIVKEWGLTQTQLGYIFSAGLFGMTLGCFVLAPLGDLIGRRPAFLLSLLLITVGMLCVFGTNAYWQILLCRFITGLGIGGILPNLATVASEFSNQKNRDFNVGLIQAGWPLGAILTGFFVAWAIPALGWRACYLVAGLVSLAMLIHCFVCFPYRFWSQHF